LNEDRLWKYFASEEMAIDISMRDIYENNLYENFIRGCWFNLSLCKILKKEWFR